MASKRYYQVVIKANTLERAIEFLEQKIGGEYIHIDPFGTTIFRDYSEIKLQFSAKPYDFGIFAELAKWFNESISVPFREGDLLYYSVRKVE